jgi:TPR repeat protein
VRTDGLLLSQKRETMHNALTQAQQAEHAEDLQELFSVASSLVELGNVPSYAVLAELYESASLAEGQRLDLAYHWYSRGAFEGDCSKCYFALGRFFLYGKHVEKNVQRAIELFEVASSKGSIEASVALGFCYLHGIGGRRNVDRARQYLRPAHDAGYVIGTALLSKVELLDRHFLRGIGLYIKSILDGKRLVLNDPDSPKLFWLNMRPDG